MPTKYEVGSFRSIRKSLIPYEGRSLPSWGGRGSPLEQTVINCRPPVGSYGGAQSRSDLCAVWPL